jgi:spermidine/putrescine transport system permease protein
LAKRKCGIARKMNIAKRVRDFIAHNSSFLFTVPAVLWEVLFLYIPLILVIYMSIQCASGMWTFAYYYELFDRAYVHIIARSAGMALAVTCSCIIIAYPVAYFLALQVPERWKNIFLFLLTLPFWTNFLILIYSWVFVLDQQGLINTALLRLGIIAEPLHMINNIYAIFLVMIYYYLPFMIMPLYTILEKIQHDVLEASMDLGATHWQTFTRITVPLSLSGVKTGVFLVFVPAFGEFVIPAIIGGGQQMFVGSLISHYFLITRDNQLGASFTIVSGIVLLVCALLFNWWCKVPLQTVQKEIVE